MAVNSGFLATSAVPLITDAVAVNQRKILQKGAGKQSNPSVSFAVFFLVSLVIINF